MREVTILHIGSDMYVGGMILPISIVKDRLRQKGYEPEEVEGLSEVLGGYAVWQIPLGKDPFDYAMARIEDSGRDIIKREDVKIMDADKDMGYDGTED